MAIDDLLNQPGGIAERLRAARLTAGLTGLQLAGALDWGHPKISKLENGRQMPTPRDIEDWARATRMPDAERLGILAALTNVNAEHQQWKHRLRKGNLEDLQTGIAELEQAGSTIRSFETLLIPGLLQTAPYAQIRLAQPSGNDDRPVSIEEAVSARMFRQGILYETFRTFEFVILDIALEARLTPPDVMRGQLDRLLAIVGQPNVHIGVIRVEDAPLNYPNPFLMFDNDLVVMETWVSSIRVRGEEAKAYGPVMDQLMSAAARGDDARSRILAAADALRS